MAEQTPQNVATPPEPEKESWIRPPEGGANVPAEPAPTSSQPDPVGKTVAGVVASVQAHAAKRSAKPPADAWRNEPASNFEQDAEGKILFHPDGTPRRVNGKPRKPRRGDRLADGTIYGGERDPVINGQVKSPPPVAPPPIALHGVPGDAPSVIGGPGVGPATFGVPASRVVVDAISNVAAGVFGPSAKPTADEKAAYEQHGVGWLSRWMIPPVVAFGVIAVAHYLRVILTMPKPTKPVKSAVATAATDKGTAADDRPATAPAHSDRGNDRDGQDDDRPYHRAEVAF